jgi:neutral trehalase
LVPYNPTLRHSAAAAKWESGLDNSPMYDDAVFNERTNTFELDDVALSSYYAMDCEALAAMAESLGKKRAATAYRQEYQTIKGRINELLWDEAHGIYCNRHWDGRLSQRWSPTSFFPLIAGIAPRDRAARMVEGHLLSESEFWGEYVLPSISRNDPAYPDNDYWRGRIWGPFNFLVAEGLRRYRFDQVAAELARKGIEMFMQNWRDDGGVYEN